MYAFVVNMLTLWVAEPPLTIMFCNNFDKWNSRDEINISGIAYVLDVILKDGCFS